MPLATKPLGNYLFRCGGLGNSEGQGAGDATSFSSMTVHPNRSVYTSEDTPNRSQRFSERKLVWEAVLTGGGANQPQDPLDITASYYDGNLYLADHGATKVNVWTAAYVFVRKWGVFNAAPTGGQIAELEAVICDGVGNVIVSDIGADRVNVYDYLGNYSRTIPSMGYFFPKLAAVNFDGTRVFRENGDVIDTTSGTVLTTLLDENGASLPTITSVYLPPGSPASNLWYFGQAGKIFRYSPVTLALTGVYSIDLNNQINPVGVSLFTPSPTWAVSTDELLLYLNDWDSPYIYSFSVAGNRGGPNVPPKGRGAGW